MLSNVAIGQNLFFQRAYCIAACLTVFKHSYFLTASTSCELFFQIPGDYEAYRFLRRTEGSTRQPYDDVQNAFESEPYGDGPERAIIQAALLQVLQRDQAFWRERDGVWYPTKVPHHQKEHTIRFNVVGTLMALTLHVFGCGAHVVSPLIHTLLFKKAMSSRNKNIKAEHLRWSLDFLSKLDESTAMAMIPWMTLKREGKSPRELQNLRGLFAQCDIDVGRSVHFTNRFIYILLHRLMFSDRQTQSLRTSGPWNTMRIGLQPSFLGYGSATISGTRRSSMEFGRDSTLTLGTVERSQVLVLKLLLLLLSNHLMFSSLCTL